MSMIKDIVRTAVTEEVVREVQKKFKQKYNQSLNTKQALWILGFEVKEKGDYRWTEHNVRCQFMPSKVFMTKVYHGVLRNELETRNMIVDGKKRTFPVVDDLGNLCYTNNSHSLRRLYEEVTVVTADMIPEELIDISEVEQEGYYTSEGLA